MYARLRQLPVAQWLERQCKYPVFEYLCSFHSTLRHFSLGANPKGVLKGAYNPQLHPIKAI